MTKFALLVLAFAFPALASAQITADSAGNIGAGFIGLINDIFVPLIFAVAFLVFIFGILQFLILGGSNEEKRDQGKQLMIWGIIGFFVMASVWGLVNILRGTFRLDNQVPAVGDVTPSVQVR